MGRVKETDSLQKKRRKKGSRQYEILGILLFGAGLFVSFSLAGESSGLLGGFLGDFFRFLFGWTAILPGLGLICLGVRYVYRGRGFSWTKKEGILAVLYLLLLCWIHHLGARDGREMEIDAVLAYGGIAGAAATWGLHVFLGRIGTVIFLAGSTATGLLLLTHWSLTSGVQALGAKTEKQARRVQSAIHEKKAEWDERRSQAAEERLFVGEQAQSRDFLFRRKKEDAAEEAEEAAAAGMDTQEASAEAKDSVMEPADTPETAESTEDTGADMPEPEAEMAEDVPEEASGEEALSQEAELSETEDGDRAEDAEERRDAAEETEACEPIPPEEAPAAPVSAYRFPPMNLLHGGLASASSGSDVETHRLTLENTLKSFGVSVRITNVSVGPTVTRYELEPAPGVKVSRITNLQDDIALQLAATQIRIEAPIPGKSAIGIEVPNRKTAEVPLRSVLDDPLFKDRKGGVPVALGKDITGKTVVTDLTKMPHLLIAGSTGSGKSVCINTLITSILYHALPEEVKLILIDPKVVELSVYNEIPHLRIPVVTDPRKAAGALHWAVREMEQRYQQFSLSRVRDIGGYNKLHPDQKLPFIIIIIDELADLMMAAPDSVEDAICRLAQKARAAGIHLVLATQRPSVDVITGVIKANIPSRISFAVSSQIDSRTILDMAGAEKLIGKGDMLFNPIGAPNPIRVQGAFITDEEVEQVTDYIKKESQQEAVVYEELDLALPEKSAKAEEPEQEDELLREAAEWVLDTKKASVSMLQRRFRIGYTRAGRLMDTMENMGIVGPAEGAKPREVRMTREQAEERFWGGAGD